MLFAWRRCGLKHAKFGVALRNRGLKTTPYRRSTAGAPRHALLPGTSRVQAQDVLSHIRSELMGAGP